MHQTWTASSEGERKTAVRRAAPRLRRSVAAISLFPKRIVRKTRSESRTDPIRVFVLEDEGRVRDAAVGMLEQRGMLVHKAARPNQLFRTARRFRPDVIVLDDRFERSGLGFSSLMPEILERFPGTKIIVTSNQRLELQPPAENPMSWGASDVVSKSDILKHRGLDAAVIKAVRSQGKIRTEAPKSAF